MNTAQEPFRSLLREVLQDLTRPGALWQIAAILACLAVAWGMTRLFKRRTADSQYAAGRWKVGMGGMKRILFPLLVVGLLLAARALLAALDHHVNIVTLAIPLFTSMALIRIFVYALRVAFAPSGVLAVFERSIAITIWGAVAFYILGILPDLIDALEAIALPVGRTKISLWLVLQGAFWVMVTLLIALWAGGVIEAKLMRAEGLHSNLRVAFTRLAKAVLVFLAVIVALPLVGIDLTVLSVFGGALGVGIGFGLQKIASNYMSGFIILLERSVRLGDMITADSFYGKVKDITTRYVVVEALDGREAIIPNELMITSTVINHSFSAPRVRHSLQVTVAYGSDVELALTTLEGLGREHARVLAEPAPAAFLVTFADSGIALDLGFWIRDPDQGVLSVKSDLNRRILAEFRRLGIAIPYPQREVRMLNMPSG